MRNSNQSFLKALTLVSFACLSIPLSIFGLWIYVFDLGNTQADRVAIFNTYFPDFLHGRWDTTYLALAFCVISVILSSIGMKLSGKIWKVLNVVILVFSSLMLLLNIFSMM